MAFFSFELWLGVCGVGGGECFRPRCRACAWKRVVCDEKYKNTWLVYTTLLALGLLSHRPTSRLDSLDGNGEEED